MSRKSNLTEAQWAALGERLLAGNESLRKLAKEFGTSEPAIRRKFPARRADIREVAEKLLSAETALRALPIDKQVSVITHLDRMRNVTMHAGSAAEYAAATMHRMSALANAQVQKIDDANPLAGDSGLAVKSVMALTEVANRASMIPVALLNATVKGAGNDKDEPIDVLAQLVEHLPN